MKALIFAAGLGSRLKPLTDNTPKALIPVGGKPMLEHVILKLKESGFDQIVINIHHLGLPKNCSVKNIKKAEQFLSGDKPFLVHNVDILSDVDLKMLYNHHLATPKSLATLLVSKRKTSRYLLFNKENQLCGWRNRETGEVKSYYPYFDPEQYTEYAFSGIHVISPEIFKWMDEWTGKFPIINFYLSICARTKIMSYPLENLSLLDVGKPETLQKANEWIEQKQLLMK